MKRLVEYNLDDGGTVLVEVDIDSTYSGAVVPTARPGEVVAKATSTLEEALRHSRPAITAMIRELRTLADADEVEIEFGLKLGAEAGAFIAAASAEATYNVKLKWKSSNTD